MFERVEKDIPLRTADGEWVAHACGRQDPGEDDEKHHAQELRWERVEQDGDIGAEVIGRAAPAHGGNHADEAAHHQRQDRSRRHHGDGVAKCLDQIVEHGLTVHVGNAKIAVQRLLEIEQILLPNRLIEAELRGKRLLERRGCVRHTRYLANRPARKDAEQDKVKRQGNENRDHSENDSLPYKGRTPQCLAPPKHLDMHLSYSVA